jgi:hypothetical protein
MSVADPMNLVLMVLHIAFAGTAFAVGLTSTGSLRRAEGKGGAVMAEVAAIANRMGRIASIFGLLTLASGLALIFYRGGFKVISPTIHGAILLVLAMVTIGFVMQRPTGKALAAAAAANDLGAWQKARKKWAMGEGIMQLLWVVTLVLMFVKRG